MDRQTPRDGIGRAYAQRRAAKIDKYRNENSTNYKCHLRSHSFKLWLQERHDYDPNRLRFR